MLGYIGDVIDELAGFLTLRLRQISLGLSDGSGSSEQLADFCFELARDPTLLAIIVDESCITYCFAISKTLMFRFTSAAGVLEVSL